MCKEVGGEPKCFCPSNAEPLATCKTTANICDVANDGTCFCGSNNVCLENNPNSECLLSNPDDPLTAATCQVINLKNITIKRNK